MPQWTPENTGVPCQRCKSDRTVGVLGRVKDQCTIQLGKDSYQEGYVPWEMNIDDGGDYISFVYCLTCWQIQGVWPLPVTQLEDPSVCNED